jgi:uncharacterized protein (TIGR00255 family)
MAYNSMTGFGSGTANGAGFVVTAELSSVNRKQLDLVISLPSAYASLDGICKELIKEAFLRGRINCKIIVQQLSDAENITEIPEEFTAYLNRVRKIAATIGVQDDITLSTILKSPVLTNMLSPAITQEALEPVLVEAVAQAIAALKQMRETEGTALAKDLLSRVAELEQCRTEILRLAPAVPQLYREQLLKRLKELNVEFAVDDASLARELALFADRCDISEEYTRLATHFAHFAKLLEAPEPAGRKLDFLCQEMNREINTIGSKANNSDISLIVIDMKSKLEAIREQVQNIE